MIIILGGKLYIMTGKALRIIRQSAYDEGVQNCYKICREMYLRKGFIVTGIPYSDTISPEALNPKLRHQIDEILRNKL